MIERWSVSLAAAEREEHREGERAGRRPGVGEREVGFREQRTFARDGRDAVGREDLRAQPPPGWEVAHAARRAVRAARRRWSRSRHRWVRCSGHQWRRCRTVRQYSVAGPDFVTSSTGGTNTNCPSRFAVFTRPPSLVMNSDTGSPLSSRKLIDNVYVFPPTVNVVGSGRVDEGHTVGTPFSGRCRIGTGRLGCSGSPHG